MKKKFIPLIVVLLAAVTFAFNSSASAAGYEVTLKGDITTPRSTTSVYTPGNLNIKVGINWGWAVEFYVLDSNGNRKTGGTLHNTDPDINYSIKVPAGNYRLYLKNVRHEKQNDFVGYLTPY
ncbi:hypothetical protein ACQCVH_22200 [Bacillus infantis]|uniref:hypothetical protein n=1 Tax=Bacillus infantis TaxID=324767 RepID=UPI003CE693C1